MAATCYAELVRRFRHLSIDFIILIDVVYRAPVAQGARMNPCREYLMSDIKLKDLRYLVAVADSRHFGRAAERCFVSQPTLSAQLKKLEQYLGVQLVERQPNNVTLTAAGEQIVSRARRILEASDEVVSLAHVHRDPLAGRLRVALLPTIGPYLLPRVSQSIHRSLPRLELRLYEYQTATLLERLQAGELDLGILALPVELEGLAARELYTEPFKVALPENHKLVSRETLRVGDLKDETLLLLEDGHCLRDQALEVCSLAGIEEKQDFRATSLETLRQMVATGAGITLLPELANCGAYGQVSGVVVRPFSYPAPCRRVGAVWRKTTAREAAIDAVCKVIVENVNLQETAMSHKAS
jgi:LysR family transcriptional regulator, hydrogen peroxide-inducible genes activator